MTGKAEDLTPVDVAKEPPVVKELPRVEQPPVVKGPPKSLKQQEVDAVLSAKQAKLAKRLLDKQKAVDGAYIVGAWGGSPNYECKYCPFSTLDEALIRRHVVKHL